MGKKQGEAARVKGNAKPSSSAKAAEMLSQIPNYSFGADIQPIGIGTLMEDSFDSNIDSDFRMVLKKLSKKDSLTKIKTLEELKNLIDTKSKEDCVSIVSYWAKSYTKLSIDNDRKIREICQQAHDKLCAKITKNIAPHLKTVMPYWIMAQCDSHTTSAKIAENCFKTMFNETKQPEVIYLCRDEILNTLHDFLIIQTAKTLSDMKSTSEDEALQKYENVLSMSINGLGLFLKFFLCESSKIYREKFDWEKLEKILFDQKFWKFSREQNLKIRSYYFSLLSQLIDLIILNKNVINLEQDENFKLRKNLRIKLVPLIFYALDEDTEASCFYVWQSILKCLNNSDSLNLNCDNFWTLLNVKKAFIPKLISLLRSHANGNSNSLNVEVIYPCLSKLLSNLTHIFDSIDEKLQFYKDFLTKIFDLIIRDFNTYQKVRFSNATNNRTKILNAYFDSINIVLDDLEFENNELVQKCNEFCENLLLDQVKQFFELYLDSSSQDASNLENNFEQLFRKLDTIISIKNNHKLQIVKNEFIKNLDQILLFKLESDQNSDKQLNILRNYFTINIKQSKVSQEIFLTNFNKVFDSPQKLEIINFLIPKFSNQELTELIVRNESAYSSNAPTDDAFKIFNSLCGNLFKNSSNLVQKVEFYILISIKLNQTTNLGKDLDIFISIEHLDKVDGENFIKSLIEDLKSKKFSQEISEILLNWFKTSEKIQLFVKNFLFENLENNSKSIYELSNILQDEQFIVEVMKKIYETIKSSRTFPDSIIELNSNLLNESFEYLKNSELLWKMLFEYFRLKIIISSDSPKLNSIVKKLINILVSNNLLEPLKSFIKSSLDDENSHVIFILNEIQSEISQSKDQNFMKAFTQSVLLTNSFNFKEMFFNLIKNSDLISKLFLDKRLNYLFNDLHWTLIESKNFDQEWLSTVTLNKITYSLSQLNSYLNLDYSELYSDWYYLILCSILIDKFYTGAKKLSSFKAEFQNLILKNKFLENLSQKINSESKILEDFVSKHFINSTLNLDLNVISLFLTYSIDLAANKEVEIFAQNLMAMLISLYNSDEESIKLYIYDIPFARHSVMDNLDNLVNNLDHYYDLFSNVLEDGIRKLDYLTKVLEVLNKEQDLPLFETNLKSFNFCLELLIKYICFYFDLLKAKNDPKLEKIFCQNQINNEFIQNKLSAYMLQILDLFLRLKVSINQNLETLIKSLSLDEFGSGYFFYYNFSNEPKTRLNWEEIIFTYKLNEFLSLFFIDLPQKDQLSAYLNDKQWDFILCYSSAMSQRIKKPIQECLNNKIYVKLIAISFYEFLFGLTNCLKYCVGEKSNYPKQIYSDWNEFFNKEIMDPILVVFVQIAEFFNNDKLDFVNRILANKISNIAGQTSFDRLLVNDLEPKFNVMDLEINHLSDQIKTVFNHLIPLLKHKIGSFQLGSYKILRVLIMNIGIYFNDETDNKILDLLPFVFRDTFYELTDLFSDLKKSVEFDHNILNFDEDLNNQSNNHIMSYLLINKLVLEMFTTNNLQFKVKLATNLRELNFSDYLMHCLFRLMPKNGFEKFTNGQDDELIVLEHDEVYFQNHFVENFACRIYKQALKMCPAMIRDWWNMQQKRISDQVDKFTTKYVSPILIDEEMKQINRSANLLVNESGSEDESSIKIKGMALTREVVSTYKMKELSMDLLIQLPINYPLGVVSVSSAKRLGVTENEWRNWLLQLTTYLTHQNGSIIQGLQIWKRNVDKKFSGVEECTICYSVIHGTNYQLPKMKCRTCKHMFHSVCLYKWFESSSKSSCPLCRNLF